MHRARRSLSCLLHSAVAMTSPKNSPSGLGQVFFNARPRPCPAKLLLAGWIGVLSFDAFADLPDRIPGDTLYMLYQIHINTMLPGIATAQEWATSIMHPKPWFDSSQFVGMPRSRPAGAPSASRKPGIIRSSCPCCKGGAQRWQNHKPRWLI